MKLLTVELHDNQKPTSRHGVEVELTSTLRDRIGDVPVHLDEVLRWQVGGDGWLRADATLRVDDGPRLVPLDRADGAAVVAVRTSPPAGATVNIVPVVHAEVIRGEGERSSAALVVLHPGGTIHIERGGRLTAGASASVTVHWDAVELRFLARAAADEPDEDVGVLRAGVQRLWREGDKGIARAVMTGARALYDGKKARLRSNLKNACGSDGDARLVLTLLRAGGISADDEILVRAGASGLAQAVVGLGSDLAVAFNRSHVNAKPWGRKLTPLRRAVARLSHRTDDAVARALLAIADHRLAELRRQLEREAQPSLLGSAIRDLLKGDLGRDDQLLADHPLADAWSDLSTTIPVARERTGIR